ncbi:hypothetical protein [Methylobrevis albus]|uniref:Uncharacterized protein n=1 Tax=Methylobrevis albus TaxID=2793297 RepID=A0A931MXV3_9HYPH|nr:hypothetical protein [Methylobrevis albus]MBH0236394.1 hypothetical protein [Methylobrevis albus]
MIDHISTPLEKLLQDSGDLQGCCVERLRSHILLAYERLSDDRHTRELMRFVISEGGCFPRMVAAHNEKLVDPLLARTQALLDEGVAIGEFRGTPAALAPVIVAPVIAMMIDTIILGRHRHQDVPSYIAAHRDLVMNGIAVTRD